MSGGGVLGLLWAAAGIWSGARWWNERAAALVDGDGAVATADGGRFGRAAEGGAIRRRQAMRLAYAAGATAVALGLLVGWGWVLALGAAMVNLGTMYRLLVFLLDEAPEPEPVAAPLAPARHVRSQQPVLSRVLLGNLAD
jgi:hypothetical protein